MTRTSKSFSLFLVMEKSKTSFFWIQLIDNQPRPKHFFDKYCEVLLYTG